MTQDPGMRGLSLEQAPPLSIPMSFFLTAPLALAAAGLVVASAGAATFASRWAPTAMAGVHLGTLGCLAMTMFGALYQMLPVVAGAPVPAARLAHAVHAMLVVGASSLVVGLATGSRAALVTASVLLGLAFACFLVPAGVAAARARVKLDTVPGMRLVLPALVTVLALGIEMALGRAGLHQVARGPELLLAHVGLGLVGWVGGLIVAVSWQVVPMFYLTEPYPRWSRLVSLAALGTTTLGTLVALLAGAGLGWVGAALVPGAVVVWLLHPAVTLGLLVRRRRRRVGESIRFWFAALAVAPLVLATGLAGYFLDEPRWVVLFGWLALVGWATTIVHGMLTRIVPFLVWFHRYSRLVGTVGTPSMRDLLPERRARVGLLLHVGTTLVGALAIGLGSRVLTIAAGVGLAVTGISLFVTLVRVLTYAGAAPPAAAAQPAV